MGGDLTAYGDAIDLHEFDWVWGRRILEADEEAPEMIDAFAQAVARHLRGRLNRREAWGWKSPHSHLLIPFLAERFPELRFIHVIRDGRAIELGCAHAELDRYRSPAEVTDDSGELERRLRYWSWANQRAAESGPRLLGDRYLRVAFEDVRSEPQQAIETMFEFSGDRPDPRLSSLIPPPPDRGDEPGLPSPPEVRASSRRFGYPVGPNASAGAEAERVSDIGAELQRLVATADRRPSWPRVSAIVPSHDGRELLERLLRGLAQRTDYPELEVIVVDNASSDGTREWIEREQFPFPVIVVRNAQDVSFSLAINLGASRSTGELLLFLNNDVEPIEPAWLRRLVVSLEQPGRAIVGSVLVDPNRASAGGSAFAVQHAGIAFRLDGGVLRPALIGLGEDLSVVLGPDREVPALAAACSLVRKRDFDAVGGFHHRFRYGGEDVDLCLKLAQRGGTAVISRTAVLLHRPMSTRRTAPAGQREIVRANHTVLLERWGPAIKREYALDSGSGERLWNADGGELGSAVSFCVKPAPSTSGEELARVVGAFQAAGHPARPADATDAWLLDDVVVHLFDPGTRHSLAPGRVNVLFAPHGRPSTLEASHYDVVIGAGGISEIVRAAAEVLERQGGPARACVRAGSPPVGAVADGGRSTSPTAVIVLGMARAGTSATMRMLNILGVSIGPEERLLGAIDDINRRGFYEHYAIMRLNTELLRRLGGSWRRPPPLAPRWESDPGLDDLREQATTILERDFAGEPLWGFKDPRTSLTLPFWRPLIGPACFVICHRHPLEIAASLKHRDEIDTGGSLELWRQYVAAAITATTGERRAFVSYRRLLDQPLSVCAELAAFLGRPQRSADPSVRAQIEGWIEPHIQHHASSWLELLSDSRLGSLDVSLSLLLELAASGSDAVKRDIDDTLSALAGRLLDAADVRAACAP